MFESIYKTGGRVPLLMQMQKKGQNATDESIFQTKALFSKESISKNYFAKQTDPLQS